MFNWLRGKKSASSSAAAASQDEAASPPAIRKPQHAYRDARMSIPIAEREFYETIQARKRASVAQSLGTTSLMNGKGKARSPLAYDSGFPSSMSTPGSSVPASHNSSRASKTDLTALWEVVAERSRYDSSAQTSVAESSKQAAAKEAKEDE